MTTRYQVFQDSQTEKMTPNWKIDSDSGDYFWDAPTAYISSDIRTHMVDEEVVSFESRRSAGELFFNPQCSETCTTSMVPCLVAWTQDWGDGRVYEGLFGKKVSSSATPFIGSTGSTTEFEAMMLNRFGSAADIAISQAFANIDVSEAMLLASLGELPETVSWAVGTIRKFIKLTKKLKSKKKAARYLLELKKIPPKEYAETVANLWLEYRYAVRPLFGEMENIMNALRKKLDKSMRFTARGSHEAFVESDTDYDFVSSYYTYSGTTNLKTQVKVRAGVMYTVNLKGSGVRELWGLDQPLESLWELVPFSFMVDWFLNVGDVLSSWTKSASAEVVGSWCTLEVEENQFTGYSCVSDDQTTITFTQDSGSFAHGYKWKYRFVDISQPLLPRVNLRLDYAKVTDIAIIGRNLFNSSR